MVLLHALRLLPLAALVAGDALRTPRAVDIVFFLPDSERQPGQTLSEDNFEDGDLIWVGVEEDPAFISRVGDARGQLKTLYKGRIDPSRTAGPVERTEPCYDREDPSMVGLGMDEPWDQAVGKGRGWGWGLERARES
jgi:hypothetical protein